MHLHRGASSSRSLRQECQVPRTVMTLGVVMDHQCSGTPVRDPAETRGVAASLWPAVEATATPREWCCGSGPRLISTLRRRFVARRCGVTMCLQLRRRQQVIRLGSSGCVRRDQHGSSTSQRINLWYQYSIAMGMLIVLTIFSHDSKIGVLNFEAC